MLNLNILIYFCIFHSVLVPISYCYL
uniref:Uncharacterized protein n=1 Tax=Anguilla anguilla TaxID=7936 RepID=A0A0E9QHW4_ANGAN